MKIKKSATSGDGVTIQLTEKDYFTKPFFKNGQVMEVDAFGKKRYNIIINTETKTHGATLTMRPLSKRKLIRKVQIFFIRLIIINK